MTRFLFSLALALCGAVASFGTASAQNPPYIMKLGTSTIDDAQHQWLKRFAAAVNKDSKGRIDAQVYPAGQLGSIPRMIENTQFGAIQGWIGPPEFLLGVDQRYQVFGTPGLFSSWDQADKVMNDPTFNKAFLSLGADKGLKGIALLLAGSNSVVSRKEVKTLADLQNMKIRILAGAAQEAEMRLLGAVGVPMPLDQVLPALQQGAIDGTLTNIMVAAPIKYYATAPYALQIDQPYVADIVVINKAWYDKLPPDLQKIIDTDATQVSAGMFAWSKTFLAEQRKAWVAGGGKLIPLTPADRAALDAKVKNVGEDVYKDKPFVLIMYRQLKSTVAKYR